MESTAETTNLRTALLELEREAPLTAEQRAKLGEKLEQLDACIAAIRGCRPADGGAEPATLFRAIPLIGVVPPEAASAEPEPPRD